MTEVVPADRTRLLQSKRAECSAIARSRKRKLCVLYEVTVNSDNLPRRSSNNPDAYEYISAEKQFLDGCDILQGRTLNELNIPSRPSVRPGYAQYPPLHPNTLVPTNNAPTTVQRTIAGFPNPDVQHTSPASEAPVAVDKEAPPRLTPQVDTTENSTNASQPGLHSKLPSNAPSEARESITAPANASMREGKSMAEEVVHTPLIGRPEANYRLSGTAAPGISLSTGTFSSGQQADSAAQHSMLPHPALVPQPTEKKIREQPFHTIPIIKIDPAPPTNPIHNPSTPRLQLPRHSYFPIPTDTPLPSNSTAQTAVLPSTPDVSMTAGPNRDSSLLARRVESGPDKEQKQSAPDGRLSNMDRARLEALSARPSMSMSPSITEQVEAQLVRDSMSATTGNAAGQHVENAGPDRILPQPAQHFRPPADANVAAREGSVSGDNKQLSNRASDPSEVGTFQSGTGQAQHIAHRDESMEANRSRDDSMVTSNDFGTRQVASTKSVSAVNPSTLSGLPSSNWERQQKLSGGLTEVALQKPVAEILGERLPLVSDEVTQGASHSASAMPITPSSQSSKARTRSLVDKARAKDKGRLSTVVFGKQPQRVDNSQTQVQPHRKPDQLPSDDYYTTLFVNGFAAGPSWMKPLDQLLHQAHKTVSTPDAYTQILDSQACRVLRRVYQLQHTDKWSLRQPKRYPEPARPEVHWDHLLKEMKWMRTDFRQERKWKMTLARKMAESCAEWVAASVEDRKMLQVNAVIPPPVPKDAVMTDAPSSQGPDSHPTPDLIPSGALDSPLEPDDELEDQYPNTVAPSAIFALQDDEVIFALQPSAASDRLLDELPMYGAFLSAPKSDLTGPEHDPDASWKRPALPLSRFVEGQMELTSNEPPKKRSRYQYVQEDAEDDEVVFDQDGTKPALLSPENPDVALFRPENKTIKDRLHAGHQFRPPSDNMPFQAFYESRSSSQWTQAEDDELKSLVREYSYNWSLIYSILSSKSLFVSGADRRTPWECFERWVMLEGLPHDMAKTQYFKLWQSRINQAQTHIQQQYSAAQQQQQAQQQAQQQQQQQQQGGQQAPAPPNVPNAPLPRRRHSLPVKVERRRNQKHLTMIDAMRKLAKKREAMAQKQQQAATRKPAEISQPKAPTKTPREYSIMRWERDQAMAERLADRMAQQQRQEAQRRVRAGAIAVLNKANVQSQAAMPRVQQPQHAHLAVAAAAQSAGQIPQNAPQMAASHPHVGMARVSAPSHAVVNGQPRLRMPVPMVSTPNGTEHQNHMTGGLVLPMQMPGAPQIQMPVVNGQAPMSMPGPSHSMHMYLQAQQQQQQQQRQSVQMRQQQQPQPQPQQSHPQASQPHQQQLAQQQSQQPHVNQQANVPLQNSPPAVRAATINSLNQKNYLNNAQAQVMMASYNAANGSGLSTPPATGYNVTPGQSGSPRPNFIMPQQQHQTYLSQLQAIENQIRSNQPDTPQDRVREMAKTFLQNRHNTLVQTAMNVVAGTPGQAAAANGPHQYAQLLRAQQQQQAAAAAAAAQAQAQAHAQAQTQAQVQVQAQAQAQAQAQGQGQAQGHPQQAQAPQQTQAPQLVAQHHQNSSGSVTPNPASTQ